MKRRRLTKREQDLALRLSKIWHSEKRKRGFTQEDAKLELGFKSQSAVSHYLNKVIPLNTNAIIKFSRFLNCKPADIDPDFPDVSSLSPREMKLVDLMRSLPEPLQESLLETARAVTRLNQQQS